MKRVFYENRRETILVYHASDAAAYVEGLGSEQLARNDELDLLRQLTSLAEFSEDLDPHGVDLPALMALAWRWHREVVNLARPMTGHYANTLLLSWVAFCKFFYTDVAAVPLRAARDYPYAAQLESDTAENVVVSDDSLAVYSVDDIFLSAQLLIPTLYVRAYSVAMADYVHALFQRYCALFCVTTPAHELERLMDNPLYCGEVAAEEEEEDDEDSAEDEAYDRYKHESVPLSEQWLLKSDYFYEGQLLFSAQLWRLRLSDRLTRHAVGHRLSGADQLVRHAPACASALTAALCALVTHGELRRFVVEEFKRQIVPLQLYHGERERFKRARPEASGEPGEVLDASRSADHVWAQATQKKQPAELLRAPTGYAKECVMVTRVALSRWFDYVQRKPALAALQACFLMEEQAPLEELDEALRLSRRGTTPYLLRLIQTYYVLWKGDVFVSTEFGLALVVWLALLTRALDLSGHDRMVPTELTAVVGLVLGEMS